MGTLAWDPLIRTVPEVNRRSRFPARPTGGAFLKAKNPLQTPFFCHPERSAGSQFMGNARFYASLRMTIERILRFWNGF
jgi:hypothetical protein